MGGVDATQLDGCLGADASSCASSCTSPEVSPYAAERLRTQTANACLLRALERIALRFNDAGVRLMALKGAALNLTVLSSPADRPMADIDLLVEPANAEAAVALLAECGARPGRPLVRDDFFPRFYYECEFVLGEVFPVVIDLHVRPLRPLRYARLVPENALWDDAFEARLGRSRVYVPSMEGMLIHLAAHSSVHGNGRVAWLEDIARWVQAWEGEMDWASFVERTKAWGLTLPVREALRAAESELGKFVPRSVTEALDDACVNWRDRLALKQAPHDATSPAAHVLVNALTAPGVGFVLAYLRGMLWPGRSHIGTWYDRRHAGWLATAYGLRLVSPLLRRYTGWWQRFAKLELRETASHRTGVFARRVLAAGERLADFDASGGGKISQVRHSCRPNARRFGKSLRAIRAIDMDEEISMDHGTSACNCRQHARAVRTRAKSA